MKCVRCDKLIRLDGMEWNGAKSEGSRANPTDLGEFNLILFLCLKVGEKARGAG